MLEKVTGQRGAGSETNATGIIGQKEGHSIEDRLG